MTLNQTTALNIGNLKKLGRYHVHNDFHLRIAMHVTSFLVTKHEAHLHAPVFRAPVDLTLNHVCCDFVCDRVYSFVIMQKYTSLTVYEVT